MIHHRPIQSKYREPVLVIETQFNGLMSLNNFKKQDMYYFVFCLNDTRLLNSVNVFFYTDTTKL